MVVSIYSKFDKDPNFHEHFHTHTAEHPAKIKHIFGMSQIFFGIVKNGITQFRSLTCGKHVKHFLRLVADFKSKSFPNNDMPAWTKLLVKNFLKNLSVQDL